jgi:hypothetical protein
MFAIVTPLGACLSIVLHKPIGIRGCSLRLDSDPATGNEKSLGLHVLGGRMVAQRVPFYRRRCSFEPGWMWRAIDVLGMSIVNVRGWGILMPTRSYGLWLNVRGKLATTRKT